MKKIQPLTLVLLMLAMLSSCTSDSFKIDGNLEGLKDPIVRIVFVGDSGLVDESVNADKKGHFTFKGSASHPTLVNVLTRRGQPITMMVATNGDHIKVKGDAGKPMGTVIKGNRLNEDWQLFRNEHKAFYTDPNPSRLDAAIEKYVKEHPTDMLSTVLIIADYSNYTDRGKVDNMLKSIDVKMRPESLTRAFQGMSKKSGNLPRLMTLTLWKHGGKFEEIKLTGGTAILSLWAQPQPKREDLRGRYKDIRDSSSGNIRVIDILTESDTLKWHQTIAGEDVGHYWAPGGPLEQGIQLLGITSLPWYAVTDSTGLVVYSGPDFGEAKKKALDITK